MIPQHGPSHNMLTISIYIPYLWCIPQRTESGLEPCIQHPLFTETRYTHKMTYEFKGTSFLRNSNICIAPQWSKEGLRWLSQMGTAVEGVQTTWPLLNSPMSYQFPTSDIWELKCIRQQPLDLGKAAWWHNVAMSCPITFYQIKWSFVPNTRHLTGIPKWPSVSLWGPVVRTRSMEVLIVHAAPFLTSPLAVEPVGLALVFFGEFNL